MLLYTQQYSLHNNVIYSNAWKREEAAQQQRLPTEGPVRLRDVVLHTIIYSDARKRE